jgi:hypothetical protein
MFDFDPWSIQESILDSVWQHPRTAVRSGNGVGKTAVSFGAIGPAFLMAHKNSVVVTTAPTWRQVKQLGWREWRRSWGVMRKHLSGFSQLQEVPIPACLTTNVELSNQWHAFGLSSREPEAFSGVHARNVLFICDEASGIDEKIYEAGEGFLTSSGSRVLLIGNPTQPAGLFYRAFTSERAEWSTHHISAFMTPNFATEGPDRAWREAHPVAAEALVDEAWVEDKRKRWGEESPLYQVRVLGNFAEQADDTIISLVSVENAQQRDAEDEGEILERASVVTLSCDVARFGSDETVIMRKRGTRCELAEVYHGRDIMTTAGKLLRYVRDSLLLPAVLRVRVIVDDDGVGGGVVDRLTETLDTELPTGSRERVDLVPFRGGEQAIEPDRFTNKRTEALFRAKWRLDALDIPRDDSLAADLVATKYRMTSSGQLQAERKDEVKKRLGRSPDRGDALVMLLEPEKHEALASPQSIPGDEEESAYELEW